MKSVRLAAGVVVGCVAVGAAGVQFASADWPQWRGANRDGRADFNAPATWPKELKPAWKVTVGDGVATPALVGGKVYVFSRENDNEVTRCLNASNGEEIWQEKYPAAGVSGPDGGFAGPRSSPAVSDGKVVTLGVHGTLSCLDAETGKKVWRKDEYQGSTPRFHVSSSPIIVDGMAIAQLGGQNNGAMVAYDLNSGEEKWKWTGESPGYASPVVLTAGGDKLIVAETDGKIIAVRAADGKLAWEAPWKAQRMGYNAATPVVEGDTLIYTGGDRGTKAVKIEKQGDQYDAKELWSNDEVAAQFNSPVLKDGVLYGLSQGNEFFALDAKTGKKLWTAPAPAGQGGMGRPGGPGGPGGGPGAPGARGAPGGPGGPAGPGGGQARGGPGGPGGPGGGRGGRGGGGGGRGGYGSIVDAGDVLLAPTPASELVVFKPGQTYAEVAKVKVSESQTHAYPVASGSQILIKDKDAVSAFEVK